MRIITFNGLGQAPGIATGHVLVLVTGDTLSVVHVEILDPDAFGPALTPALNDAELAGDVRAAYRAAYPGGLPGSQHWVLECPPEIASRARFPVA
jgi:hypothetical protein